MFVETEGCGWVGEKRKRSAKETATACSANRTNAPDFNHPSTPGRSVRLSPPSPSGAIRSDVRGGSISDTRDRDTNGALGWNSSDTFASKSRASKRTRRSRDAPRPATTASTRIAAPTPSAKTLRVEGPYKAMMSGWSS